jgi:hypothetical protein
MYEISNNIIPDEKRQEEARKSVTQIYGRAHGDVQDPVMELPRGGFRKIAGVGFDFQTVVNITPGAVEDGVLHSITHTFNTHCGDA